MAQLDLIGLGIAALREAEELEKCALALAGKESVPPLQRALRKHIHACELLMAALHAAPKARTRGPTATSAVREALPRLLEHGEDLSTRISALEAAPAAAISSTPASKELSEDTQRLREGLKDVVMHEKPTLTWDDVAGLEGAKRSIEEAVILPQKFPQLFQGKRKAWKGILLYGPPGTGKTLLARACASMTDAEFFAVSSSSLVSKWFGDSERLVRELFAVARESAPSIVFIDEIDSICGKRAHGEHESGRRLKTEFLVQMQNVLDGSGVLVLAATNRPWDLDPAVRRRFEKRIYIPLPDLEARRTLLRLHFGGAKHEHEFALENGDSLGHLCDRLAEQTEGYSGSDIATLTRDALLMPVRRTMRATHFRAEPRRDGSGGELWTPCEADSEGAVEMSLVDLETSPDTLQLPLIHESDLAGILTRSRPSVSASDLEEQEKFTRQYGISGRSVERVERHRSVEDIRAKWEDNEAENARRAQESTEEDVLFQFVDKLTSKLEDRRTGGGPSGGAALASLGL